MNERAKSVRRSWRQSRIFAIYLFPAAILLISDINIWTDHQEGRPFNPTHLYALVGFIAFDGVLFGFMWIIYRLVLGVVSSGNGKL